MDKDLEKKCKKNKQTKRIHFNLISIWLWSSKKEIFYIIKMQSKIRSRLLAITEIFQLSDFSMFLNIALFPW